MNLKDLQSQRIKNKLCVQCGHSLYAFQVEGWVYVYYPTLCRECALVEMTKPGLKDQTCQT